MYSNFKETEPYVVELRRYFHKNPELSLKEFKTVEKIKKELELMGIETITTSPAPCVIGVINGENTGKSIALRADIDALPMQEEIETDYKSSNDGVAHTCGHDAHTAMLLGAAKILNENKEKLNGRIYIVFQSGEEIGGGHKEVIDYLDSVGGVDEVMGIHIWSQIPAGEILLINGGVFAGGYGFEIKVKGVGGHGARPDLCKEPIKAASDLVLKISSIPSNFYDVMDPSVVTIGQFTSGTTRNIFPDIATIGGTIRFFKKDGAEKIVKHIERMAKGIEEIYQVNVEVNWLGGVIPVVNSPESIELAKKTVEEIKHLTTCGVEEPIPVSDNYAYIVEHFGGAYGILGAGNAEKDCVYAHHNSKFNIDEDVLIKGTEFFVRYTNNFLK